MESNSELTKKLDKIIKQFLENEFKKEIHDKTLRDKKIFPDDFIDIAINHACRDMMVRTLKVKDPDVGFNDKIRNTLTECFKNFFVSDEAYHSVSDFEKWHKETCDAALEILFKRYVEPQYGKAQKLVNMTFKYLYCFADENQRQTYFEFCHMPIDSVILTWIKKEAHIPDGKIPCWSNLRYSDSDGKYSYKKLVSVINDLLPKDLDGRNRITPLQAEFFIWPTVQLSTAADEFSRKLKKFGNIENIVEDQMMQTTLRNFRKDVKDIFSVLTAFESDS